MNFNFFKFFSVFFVIFVLLFSFFVFFVNAGVLKLSIENANDGVHGSKITVSWFQGDDILGLGPDQCGDEANDGVPGNDVPYVFKDSDSSFYPNVDSDTTGCNYCGGNIACNDGLDPEVENYYCNSKGECKSCQACPSGCDFGEECNTDYGTCNSKCVCDPATCTGNYCSGNNVYSYGCSGESCTSSYVTTCLDDKSECNGRTLAVYNGCVDGSCSVSITTYPCDGCANTVSCTCDIYLGEKNNQTICKQTTATYCPGSDCPCVSDCYV